MKRARWGALNLRAGRGFSRLREKIVALARISRTSNTVLGLAFPLRYIRADSGISVAGYRWRRLRRGEGLLRPHNGELRQCI